MGASLLVLAKSLYYQFMEKQQYILKLEPWNRNRLPNNEFKTSYDFLIAIYT